MNFTGLEHAFDVFSPSRVTTFNIPYDQLSIMHYPAYAFSRNGQPTISAKVRNCDNMFDPCLFTYPLQAVLLMS